MTGAFAIDDGHEVEAGGSFLGIDLPRPIDQMVEALKRHFEEIVLRIIIGR